MTMREKLLTAVLSVTLGSVAAAAYGIQDARATFEFTCRDFTGCDGDQICLASISRENCVILCEDSQGEYLIDCLEI